MSGHHKWPPPSKEKGMSRQTRQLSGWQMVLVIIAMFCGTFGGMAWMTDQLLLDCAEQQKILDE